MERLRGWAVVCLLAAGGHAMPAFAQGDYPARPLRLIVPYPPGGGADTVGRAVAPGLSARLGQQVVVDNRGGAATAIGADIAANAAADGYTLLLATVTTLAVNPNLRKELPYDPVTSFAPIALLASQPQLLVVPASLGTHSVKELIERAKAHPGALNYASPGIGSGGHLAGALLNSMAGISTVHVPYKGAGPAVTDLLAGRASFMFATMSTVRGHVQAGKLVGLAVSTAARSPAMPDVPTVAEAGVPGYAMRSWDGIVAPAGTPGAIVAKLNRDVVATLSEDDVERHLERIGFDPSPSTPREFATFIREQLALHEKIIRSAGLK